MATEPLVVCGTLGAGVDPPADVVDGDGDAAEADGTMVDAELGRIVDVVMS